MTGLRLIATWTGAALVITAVAGWRPLLVWLERHDKLAGWVQAVGSVVAIYIAVWSVNRAHANQTRARAAESDEQYTRYLEAVFQIVGGAERVCAKIQVFIASVPDQLVSIPTMRLMRDELAAIRAAVDRIDLMKLHQYEFIQAVLATSASIPGVIEEISIAIEHASLQGADGEDVAQIAGEVSTSLRPRAEEIRAAIDARGGVAKVRVPTFLA